MSIAAMIASIKFNDRRTKREAFSHLNPESNSNCQGIKVEPVSEEVLEEIRNKMKKQNQVSAGISFVIIVISTAITLWLIL